MATTVRTETDPDRSYLHILIADDGTTVAVSDYQILPGTAAVEQLRSTVEKTLTGQPLTGQVFKDAIDDAMAALAV